MAHSYKLDQVKSLCKEFDRVAKKQKRCAQVMTSHVDLMIASAEKCRAALDDDDMMDSGAAVSAPIAALKTSVEAQKPKETLSSEQKEMHHILSKFGKLTDKALTADLDKVGRPVKFEKKLLNQVIAQHFFRQGSFELGELFVNESGQELPEGMKEPFVDMYQVLEAIKREDLGPALEWAKTRSKELELKCSTLEFKLNRLQFIRHIKTGDKSAALTYARSNFSQFSSSPSHMAEIQRLMACFLYVGRLEQSPYKDMLSPALWQDIEHAFTRDCCSLLGMSYESPLFVSITTGSTALPVLLKYATVMQGKSDDFAAAAEQIAAPVEINLGDEFRYHSIFSCPVSRDQSSEDNPPMLLPCGHVICKVSLTHVLAKSSSRNNQVRFKCPVCSELVLNVTKQIHF